MCEIGRASWTGGVPLTLGLVEKPVIARSEVEDEATKQSPPSHCPTFQLYLAYSCTGSEEIATSRGLRPWLLAMTGLGFFNTPLDQ